MWFPSATPIPRLWLFPWTDSCTFFNNHLTLNPGFLARRNMSRGRVFVLLSDPVDTRSTALPITLFLVSQKSSLTPRNTDARQHRSKILLSRGTHCYGHLRLRTTFPPLCYRSRITWKYAFGSHTEFYYGGFRTFARGRIFKQSPPYLEHLLRWHAGYFVV